LAATGWNAWFKRIKFQQGPQDLYMEHGYIQHLAIMIYSFTEKQHPISMIYVITAGGIQSLVM
jgi:hypothetical protein